jgi:hypothetical protein
VNGVRISITEEELETQVKKIRPEVLLTMGAGDIDLWVSRLNEIMREIYEELH